jgi:hypothetical protein
VLEANHGINEGSTDSINGTNSFYVQKSMSSASDVNDSISAGNMGHFSDYSYTNYLFAIFTQVG